MAGYETLNHMGLWWDSKNSLDLQLFDRNVFFKPSQSLIAVKDHKLLAIYVTNDEIMLHASYTRILGWSWSNTFQSQINFGADQSWLCWRISRIHHKAAIVYPRCTMQFSLFCIWVWWYLNAVSACVMHSRTTRNHVSLLFVVHKSGVKLPRDRWRRPS